MSEKERYGEFNTTVRQMTEMSRDQNVSAKNDRNVSAKQSSQE